MNVFQSQADGFAARADCRFCQASAQDASGNKIPGITGTACGRDHVERLASHWRVGSTERPAPVLPRHAINIVNGSKPASAKQIDLLTKLSQEKDLEHPVAKRAMALARAQWTDGLLGVREASSAIDALINLPNKIPASASSPRSPRSPRSVSGASPASRQPAPEAPEGFHKLGSEIFKVQRSEESGKVYAKILKVTPDGSGGIKTSWLYAPGAARKLSEATLLQAADASEFGKLYGICVYCSRRLSDERSVIAGYGPVCAERFGLPWGS